MSDAYTDIMHKQYLIIRGITYALMITEITLGVLIPKQETFDLELFMLFILLVGIVTLTGWRLDDMAKDYKILEISPQEVTVYSGRLVTVDGKKLTRRWELNHTIHECYEVDTRNQVVYITPFTKIIEVYRYDRYKDCLVLRRH